MRPLFLPFPALLIGGVCLLSAGAQAQVRVSVGPVAGLTVATASYDYHRAYHTGYIPGFEAGAAASLSRGHFALQPALLFVQKGFVIDDDYTEQSVGQTTRIVVNSTFRLNYLTLPLTLAYTQGPDGQGLQAFAGPYVGLLLGGDYTSGISYSVSTPHSGSGGYTKTSGKVAAGDYHLNTPGDETYYSRRYDAGVQGGLGYRHGPALLQLGYSLGLRNLGADYSYGSGASFSSTPGPVFRNRAFQFSATYLFSTAR